MRVMLILMLMLLLAVASAAAQEGDPGITQGRVLAQRMCAGCHAIGRDGESPHADAPAFRDLDRRLDLDTFMERLRTGVTAGHPDMPMFRFTREDARAFTRYVRSIQAP
jgi:mono/diheme cytochrome c family protein